MNRRGWGSTAGMESLMPAAAEADRRALRLRAPRAVRLHRAPNPLRAKRHVEMPYPEGPERVHHRVDDGRRGADGGGLTDAFRPQRIEGRRGYRLVRHEERQVLGARNRVVHERAGHQLALWIVDDLLEERLGDALGDAAVHLAVDQERAHPGAAVVHRDVAPQVDAPGVAVHLHDGDMGAEWI